MTSLQDIPKKIQYIVVDSEYVNGSNNTFSLDLTLKSNTHVEDSSRVLGVKLVDFYITQVGDATPTSASNPSDIAKYVDIVCPDIPQRAQMLDERHGQIFARIPLERHYTHESHTVLRDKQWKSFRRQTNYFNPISIKKLNFNIYEHQDDGGYHTLQPDSKWYMILEITSVDIKEKPVNREAQILEALYALIGKIDLLHQSVQRLPNKEEAEKLIIQTKRKKFSFNYVLIAFFGLLAGYVYYINKIRASIVPIPF
tara:strand:+ start:1135 stop:1899 length:765 start_codon:yes stop_codon:yes gene_type:complete